MRAIGNGIGIPFRRNTGQGVIWPPDLKSALVCWYSPRKQKLTEYDVIEAYTEDFKKWNNSPEKYTGSLTSNSLALTNVSQKTALIYSPIKPYDFKVLIRGLQEGQHVKFGFDYGELILEADKDGVYTLEWKEGLRSYGIYTNFIGECNITITQLPTSILKDFSGNGLDAYMYGFQGKLNSGMGVYKFDFLSDLRINSAYLPYTERQDDKICSLAGHPAHWLFQFTSLSDIPAFKVEVKGIVNDNFTYRWYDENGNRGVNIAINEDGIYELPMSYSVETNAGVGIVCNDLCQDNVCFTQLPDYPNQLCYSGKEYCISYNQPILTDYTVIADRTWFAKDSVRTFSSKYKDTTVKPGLFKFEWAVNNSEYTSSLGKDTSVTFSDGITWQTKTSYNGKALTNLQYEDGEHLIIGDYAEKIGNYYIGCHSDFLLFNRTLSEDEINWLKDNWEKI